MPSFLSSLSFIRSRSLCRYR